MLDDFLNVSLQRVKVDSPVGISSMGDHIMKMSNCSEFILSHEVLISELRKNVESFIHDHINREERREDLNGSVQVELRLLMLGSVALLLLLLPAPSFFKSAGKAFCLPDFMTFGVAVYLPLSETLFSTLLSCLMNFLLKVYFRLLLSGLFFLFFLDFKNIVEILLNQIQYLLSSSDFVFETFVSFSLLRVLVDLLVLLEVFSVSLINLLLKGILSEILDH